MENLTPQQAKEIQNNLRRQVILKCPKNFYITNLKLIAGCDVSMNLFSTFGFGGFVVLNNNLEKIDECIVKDEITFPYIPGLLSFREIPMLLKAWKKLKTKPEVLLVDGVGIAHPRKMGIATHLGLILNIPTIGCAKNNLYGTYNMPENFQGAYEYILDPKSKEKIGAVVRTKNNVKPMFISPGHLMDVESAIEIVMKCIRKHRLPEPTRIAHNTVNEYRIHDKIK